MFQRINFPLGFRSNLYQHWDLLFMPSFRRGKIHLWIGLLLTCFDMKKKTCYRVEAANIWNQPIFKTVQRTFQHFIVSAPSIQLCICVFDERDYHNGIIFLGLKLALKFVFNPRSRSIVSKMSKTVRILLKIPFLFRFQHSENFKHFRLEFFSPPHRVWAQKKFMMAFELHNSVILRRLAKKKKRSTTFRLVCIKV